MRGDGSVSKRRRGIFNGLLPTCLPVLDGPPGPSRGENATPANRCEDDRIGDSDVQRLRSNRDQKEISIDSESTGELPRTKKYESEGPESGPAPPETAQGPGNEEGLPAKERIITSEYRWLGWDISGSAEGQCRPTWIGEMHNEGSSLDAA